MMRPSGQSQPDPKTEGLSVVLSPWIDRAAPAPDPHCVRLWQCPALIGPGSPAVRLVCDPESRESEPR
jgi:hypothetical protein